MTAVSITRRRYRGALLAVAITMLIALCASSAAHAQFNCGPCNYNATYRLVIDSMPVALGFVSPTVDLTDVGTGTTLSYTHSGLTQGSIVNQQFNPSNPGHQYEVTDVSLTYCTNHVIFQVSCTNLTNPYVDCIPVTCNGNSYCIKFKFELISSPSGEK